LSENAFSITSKLATDKTHIRHYILYKFQEERKYCKSMTRFVFFSKILYRTFSHVHVYWYTLIYILI